MKPIFALMLLAVLGFAVAGCGSGKKTYASGPITVNAGLTAGSTTGPPITTILNVKTGTHIRCRGWKGNDLRVPRLGSRLTLGESAKFPGLVMEPERELMFLTHSENGSISVACSFVQPR